MKAAIEQIGPYRVEEKIGTGGMASVFRAVKVGIGGFEHNVAVKVLHPHLADDEEFVSMFHAEARLASRLSHPVLVPVNDLGVVEGTHYMAMDLLLGETLADLYERFRKKGKPFPRGHALYIMERALDGLHYAHELALEDGSPANIVHRDVSPRNVFITTSGAVRVVDFGIARSSGRSRQTRAGIVKGTVPYMAPEQARAQDLDRRADLFAAGVLLHHLLTGDVPFDSGNTEAQRRALACEEITDTSFKDIHLAVRPVVTRALAARAEDRFDTAEDMRHRLEEARLKLEPDYNPQTLAALVSGITRRKSKVAKAKAARRKKKRGTATGTNVGSVSKAERPSTAVRDERPQTEMRATRGADGQPLPKRTLPPLEPWDGARTMSLLGTLLVLLGLIYTFLPAAVV